MATSPDLTSCPCGRPRGPTSQTLVGSSPCGRGSLHPVHMVGEDLCGVSSAAWGGTSPNSRQGPRGWGGERVGVAAPPPGSWSVAADRRPGWGPRWGPGLGPVVTAQRVCHCGRPVRPSVRSCPGQRPRGSPWVRAPLWATAPLGSGSEAPRGSPPAAGPLGTAAVRDFWDLTPQRRTCARLSPGRVFQEGRCF